MADPQAAAANQLRNIESTTGKSFAQLCLLIQSSGLSKVGEQRQMFMQQLGPGGTLTARRQDARRFSPLRAQSVARAFGPALGLG